MKPVFSLVICTEPNVIDNFVWGTRQPQLSLTQDVPLLRFCRKETQELSSCCALHRYVSPSSLPCASQGLPPSHQGQSQVGLLPFQTKRSCDSGEETPQRTTAQGEWRCGTAAPGAQCVMTPGAWQRPRWCVSSWAVAMPWKPCGMRHLALEVGASGWTRCSAGAGSPPCGTVLRGPGGRATASMRRMLE